MIIDQLGVEDKKIHSLTRQQVHLLKSSFKQLNTRSVGYKFYSKLFELAPGIKNLFTLDQIEQMDKLMSVLELVVFSFEEKSENNFRLQESLIIPLRDLGRRHDIKGIQAEHYKIANDLLLNVIKDEMGFLCTSEVKESWHDALMCISEAMQDTSIDIKSNVSNHDFSVKEKFGQIISLLKKINFHQ